MSKRTLSLCLAAMLPLVVTPAPGVQGSASLNSVRIDRVQVLKERHRLSRLASWTIYKVAVDYSWSFDSRQRVTLSYSTPGRAERRLTRKRVRGTGSRTKRRSLRINDVYPEHKVTFRAYRGRDMTPSALLYELELVLNESLTGLSVVRAEQTRAYDTFGDGTHTSYEGEIDLYHNLGEGTLVELSYTPVPDPGGGAEVLSSQWLEGNGLESRSFSVTFPNSVESPRIRIRATASGSSGSLMRETEVALRRPLTRGGAWSKTYGGPYNDSVLAIDATGDGGLVYAGNATFDAAARMELWVVKTSPGGTPEWQKSFSDGAPLSSEHAYAIRETPGGGFIVAGSISSADGGFLDDDALVLELAPDGSIEWSARYGGPNMDRAYSIDRAAEGGYVVAGFRDQPFDPHTTLVCEVPGADFWVLELDAQGGIVWQKTFGSAALDEQAHSVQQTRDGGFIVTGFTRPPGCDFRAPLTLRVLKLDGNGGVVWSRDYGASGNNWLGTWSSVQEADDGGYVVAATFSSSLATFHGANLLKLDPSGDIEWQRKFSRVASLDWGDVTFTSLRKTGDGGFLVAGSTQINTVLSLDEGPDALVAKVNRDGVVEWMRRYGHGSPDRTAADAASGAVETAEGYVVAGVTGSYGAGLLDGWILKLDLDGSVPPLSDVPAIKAMETALTPVSASLAVSPTDSVRVPAGLSATDRVATVEQQ